MRGLCVSDDMCVTPHTYIWQVFIMGGHCV